MKSLVGTSFNMGVGGVQTHIEFLKNTLSAKGIYVELVYSDVIPSWRKMAVVLRSMGNIDRARAELTKIRTNNAWKKMEGAIKKEKFDLIHAHDVLLANCAVLNSQIPVVLTVHGPLSKEIIMAGNGSPAYLKYLQNIEKQAYECVSSIISVDSGQKEIIVQDYHILPEKIDVIYNAVDTDMFAPKFSDKTDAPPFFLVPRRLVAKNGVNIAIKAFRSFIGSDAELWIAGDGPERKNLNKLVKDLNLSKHVRFLGSMDRETMVSLMNSSIGIIIPSVPVAGVIEATSLAALEGMSVAKPVFASNIGGLAEIIKHNETGFLFESGDDKALAILLDMAINNNDIIKNIGINARQYVVSNHSLGTWAQKIIEVYKSMIK